jgi:curved DNA-binding protein CbpA
MKEYYKILQVPFWASDDEVKKAYRVLVQQHHPDRNGINPDAEMKIKEINEAYTVLGNTDKRKEYDFKCIINNHYTSHQQEAGEKHKRREESFFSAEGAAAFSQADDTLSANNDNLLKQWKKVLWVSIPVLALIMGIYFLLPGKIQEGKSAADSTQKNEAPATESSSKIFTPVSNASLVTKWQNDKILYKLSVWMPAGNKTPAEQSRFFFGDQAGVDFFDKEGFKIFHLPLQKLIMDNLWKRQDSVYTLTISEQADIPYSTYTLLSDWKINYSPATTVQESFSPEKSNEKKSTEQQPARDDILIKKPLVTAKSTKRKAAESASNDILEDETIRNGYKKNK